jgi:hypothetical protein
LHGTAIPLEPLEATPVCASAATLFSDSLRRIADLNGIPLEANSWLHSSIANRMRLLQGYIVNPAAAARLGRVVVGIKTVLLIGMVIGSAVTAWIYWPH